MPIPLTFKILQKPPSAAEFDKQTRFGTAVGLTATAKQGQEAVFGALRGLFTLRGSWFQQQNKFGIKVKPATKTDLAAEVRTQADWLLKQIHGGDVFPYKNFLAIPTENVRRRKSTQIIPRAQRPKNLLNAFVVKSRKSGVSVLMQRRGRGKNKGLVAMYILVKKVRIKPTDAFYNPISKVVQRRGAQNILDGIERAFATAK
jgi:hypothetical protein